MNKKIILSLVALILAASGVYFLNQRNTAPINTPQENIEQPSEPVVTKTQSSSTTPTTPANQEKEAIKNMAWDLFQKYLYLSSHS